MNGDHLDDLIPALEGFHGDVIDLAYGHHSRFIHRAQKLGLKTQDGLPMLVEQAMLCQSLWWGKSSKFVAIMDELTNKGTLQHCHKDL
jgi:shikimate 5-dehydrogenase